MGEGLELIKVLGDGADLIAAAVLVYLLPKLARISERLDHHESRLDRHQARIDAIKKEA